MKISLIQKKKLKKFSSDKLREECGIFGISNHENGRQIRCHNPLDKGTILRVMD